MASGLWLLAFEALIIKPLRSDYKGLSPKAKGQSVQFAAVLRGSGDVNVISTRRFLARLAKVVFGATGFAAPIPFAWIFVGSTPAV
jgi:hypothetical protein